VVFAYLLDVPYNFGKLKIRPFLFSTAIPKIWILLNDEIMSRIWTQTIHVGNV